jgi:hypothetical protein
MLERFWCCILIDRSARNAAHDDVFPTQSGCIVSALNGTESDAKLQPRVCVYDISRVRFGNDLAEHLGAEVSGFFLLIDRALTQRPGSDDCAMAMGIQKNVHHSKAYLQVFFCDRMCCC